MSEKKRYIDRIFRKGLADNQAMPPAEAWEKINSRLERDKKRGFVYDIVRIAAAVIILLGFGGGLLQIIRQDKEDDNYLPTYRTETTSFPEIADMPAPRQTSSYTDDKEVITEMPPGDPGLVFRESQGLKDLKLPSSTKDPEIREPQFPGPVVSKPVTEIAYTVYVSEPDIRRDMPTSSYPVQDLISYEKQRRWSAGVMAAPSYSFRSLSTSLISYKEQFNNSESGIVSFSGRVAVSYMINDRFSVQTGIDLMKMGQNIQNMYIVNDPVVIALIESRRTRTKQSIQPVQNSLGEIYTATSNVMVTNLANITYDGPDGTIKASDWNPGRIIQNLNYLQVPLILRCRISNGGFGLVASGGLGASFLTGNKVMLIYEGENFDIGKTLNVKSFGLSGIVGLGMEHQISNNIILTIEPRLSHFITPVNRGVRHQLRPYSLSFYSGLSFRF
jgi:hypothetical protein